MHLILDHLIRRPVLNEVADFFHRPALGRRVDHQSLRIAILLVVIALLNLIDLAYTLFADSISMLHEQNPLAASFLGLNHGQVLIYYKIMMVLTGSFMLWKLRHRRTTILACWTLIGAYAWLGVVWWNWAGYINIIFELGPRLGRQYLP